MSGPIKFRILAIVIGIKNLGYVRKKVVQRSIHSYRIGKVIFQESDHRMACLADLWGEKFDPPGLSRQRAWNKNGAALVVLNKWKDV